MLIILPQLGNPGNIVGSLLRAVGIAAVFLTAVVLLGTRLLPRLFQRVLEWGSRELFLVAVVATGVGVGYVTQAVGLSFALGAFVAGLIMSESEFSHQALSDVVPVRDIFGLLFFVTVGMLFDPRYAIAHPVQIVIVVILIMAGKALIFGGLTRAFGYVSMAPWIVALGLPQIGEFSFVLARTGASANLLSKPTYDLILTCTVLTMALSPLVSRLALPLGRAASKPVPMLQAIDLSKDVVRDHVVVGGYGRTGKAAARVLRAAGIPVLVVELNYAMFSQAVRDGFTAICGDITGEAVLRAAHLADARILVIAVPDQSSVHLAVQRARAMNPKLAVIVRAVREHHVPELRSMDVQAVIQPEFEGGVEMVRQALVQYDHDNADTNRLVAEVRGEFYGTSGTASETITQ
jgi:CPA2 family monovalent cation:H+ antiporter-2